MAVLSADDPTDLGPFGGSWIGLLQTVIAPDRWASFEELLDSGCELPDEPTDLPTWLPIHEDLLKEPRAVVAALAAMTPTQRARLCELAVIEEWTVRSIMSFATNHQLHFRTMVELGGRGAVDVSGVPPWPIHGPLTFDDFVALGPQLDLTLDDLIDVLLSGYPRCGEFPGLDRFIIANSEALRSAMADSPTSPELHAFFQNVWELPSTVIALFRAELEQASAVRTRTNSGRTRKNQAKLLLARLG